MKRAPIAACLGAVLAGGLSVYGVAQTKTAKQPTQRAASTDRKTSSEVYIAATAMPSGSTSLDISDDHWNARGFDLKTLISQIYDIDLKRIDLADSGATSERYDVTLQLPHEVEADMMQQMLTNAIQKKFGLRITPETRSMEVYVMSAPNGPGSQLHRHAGSPDEDDAGRVVYMGKDCPGSALAGIAVSATTLSEFGRTLESDLDSAVVDETKLPGSYDFKIGNYSNKDELLKLLHDELGLVIKPSERKLTVLKVRPQGEFASL